MNVRQVPADQQADANTLAALLDLIPVREEGQYVLMPRREIIGRVEEFREIGDREKAIEFAKAMEFNAEAVFREVYSQVASKSVRVETATLFRMLREAAGTGENRSEVMRRVLRPEVEELIDQLGDRIDDDKEDMVRYSLKEWKGHERQDVAELEANDFQEGDCPLPAMKLSLRSDELPADLRKYSRYFLKNLFRLNNIHGNNQFYYPPEIVERYWEFVSPNQGIFELEMVPASGSLAVRIFDVSRKFGLERTENPDYYALVEAFAQEARKRCIKGSRTILMGRTAEDDEVLEKMMSIEVDRPDEPIPHGIGCIAHDLSPEGLEAFRRHLRTLSGIKAEVLFPISERSVDGKDDLAVLGFDVCICEETGRFRLDDAEASERSMHEVVLAVGNKLLGLSRQVYRDPTNFPQPDIDELDAEVRLLIDRAEEDGLTEEMAREIVAKITVLDFYESLAKFSYALGEQLVKYLEGQQTITFAIPRVLLALLNRVLEERTADELVLSGLGGAEDA